MKLIVNGSEHELLVANLAELLQRLGYGDAIVATALNHSFVIARSRAATLLSPGDEVEILAPMQGG